MKVLAISSYGVLGGAELSFAAFLRYRPPDVEAGVLLLEDGPLSATLADLGLDVRVLSGFQGRPTVGRAAQFSRRFAALLRETRPDVVWAVSQKATLLAAPTCRLLGVPLVWHKVDFAWDSLLAKPLGLVATGVIGCSRAVVEPLGPFRGKVLGIVWPPVTLDDEVAATLEAGEQVIGTLGRLVPYKGHHLIVEAAAHLSQRFPSLRVVLAGAPVREYPHYPESLLRLARDLGLGGRVELPGFVTEVGSVLAGLTVFVNATHRDSEGYGVEALGAGILEAGWAGVPVVAVAGGGVAEVVHDGRTGTLVPSPEPALLARAIEPYLADRKLALRSGAAGRKFVRGAGVTPEASAAHLFGLLRPVAQG